MKYKCTHCNHIFEAVEADIGHCPKCFWTTSLTALSEESKESANPSIPSDVSSPAQGKPSPKPKLYSLFLVSFIFLIAAAGGFLFFKFFQKYIPSHFLLTKSPSQILKTPKQQS